MYLLCLGELATYSQTRAAMMMPGKNKPTNTLRHPQVATTPVTNRGARAGPKELVVSMHPLARATSFLGNQAEMVLNAAGGKTPSPRPKATRMRITG